MGSYRKGSLSCRQVLIHAIGEEFYATFADRILFAVSVDSIECWLLPLYYADNRASKYKNCVDTLNQKLRSDGYTIDHKNDRVYNKLSANYRKRINVDRAAKKQESLLQFLTELQKLSHHVRGSQ